MIEAIIYPIIILTSFIWLLVEVIASGQHTEENLKSQQIYRVSIMAFLMIVGTLWILFK